MRKVIEEYRKKGFAAFKIGWGPFGRARDSNLDRAIVKAAREAAGPEALRRCRRQRCLLAARPQMGAAHCRDACRLRVGWFEEPLRPDAIDDYRELREASPVPIAGGEVLTRRQSFIPWLVKGALDIVQPDVTKVGVISEQRRIAWMAYDFGVKYIGHGWNTALGVAADLQFASAFPDCDLVEFIGGSPYVDGILKEPFKLDTDGFLTIPDHPGLGVEIDREKLARFTPNPDVLFA